MKLIFNASPHIKWFSSLVSHKSESCETNLDRDRIKANNLFVPLYGEYSIIRLCVTEPNIVKLNEAEGGMVR
jgi:hypothetical protein